MSKNSPRNTLEATIAIDLFEPRLSKSQRTRLRILEAAIACYATTGFEGATYDRIAKKAKTSRPLVMHYYPDRDELLLEAIKFVRANFQRVAIEAAKAAGPGEALAGYVASTFDWIEKFHSHAVTWILFYYGCAIRPKWNEINTELVRIGHARISMIIGEKGLGVRAKRIQLIITGALISALTEELPVSLPAFRKSTLELCRAVARG